MDDKEFKRMNLYNNRVNEENREKYNKYKVNKDEKEPKTAIWWAIMLFCIVYGIQVVYNNILLNGGL